MKNRKRRFEVLSYYNHTGIEDHLSKMAEKGWMIEQISNYFWTYRRISPQKLQFTVSYYPRASEFDPAPSEAQQTLLDFCAADGWKLACTWFQMQIFYTEAEEPASIHTDPGIEVETIHKACKANYLRGCKILLVISLVWTALFVSSLIGDTLRILASPSAFMTGLCFSSLFLLSGVELAAYYIWYGKAKRAAEHEIFLDTPSTSGFQRIVLCVLGLCMVCWVVSLLVNRDQLMIGIAVAIFLCIAATVILMNKVKGQLKKKQLSTGVNRVLTSLTGFVIAFVLMGAVSVIGIHIMKQMQLQDLPLYPVEAPLHVSELMETEYDSYLNTASSHESPFLRYMEVQQRHGFEDEASSDIPELQYEWCFVKVPTIYRFCEEQMKRQIVLSEFWDGHLIDQDPSVWGAERVYRFRMEDGTEKNLYMLCYEDILVQIKFNWTPTAEQMAMVGEKLGHIRME